MELKTYSTISALVVPWDDCNTPWSLGMMRVAWVLQVYHNSSQCYVTSFPTYSLQKQHQKHEWERHWLPWRWVYHCNSESSTGLLQTNSVNSSVDDCGGWSRIFSEFCTHLWTGLSGEVLNESASSSELENGFSTSSEWGWTPHMWVALSELSGWESATTKASSSHYSHTPPSHLLLSSVH